MTPGQEALIEAMRLEQARIYSTTVPEPRRMKVRDEDVPVRDLASTYGAAPPEVIREVADALSPVRALPQLPNRRSVEQGIARGLGDLAIATECNVSLLDVEHIRTELEDLSA